MVSAKWIHRGALQVNMHYIFFSLCLFLSHSPMLVQAVQKELSINYGMHWQKRLYIFLFLFLSLQRVKMY